MSADRESTLSERKLTHHDRVKIIRFEFLQRVKAIRCRLVGKARGLYAHFDDLWYWRQSSAAVNHEWMAFVP